MSVAAGELFWVEDYFAMQEKILKYASEENYYKQMSEKAKKRAEEPETFNQSQIHRIQSSRIQNKLLTDGNIN